MKQSIMIRRTRFKSWLQNFLSPLPSDLISLYLILASVKWDNITMWSYLKFLKHGKLWKLYSQAEIRNEVAENEFMKTKFGYLAWGKHWGVEWWLDRWLSQTARSGAWHPLWRLVWFGQFLNISPSHFPHL